MTYPNTTVWK